MKRGLIALLLTLCLLLTGCQQSRSKDSRYTLACTTYPVYLLTQSVISGVDGIEATLVIDQQVSCLHDYTLTMQDMKHVEQSDAIVMNGAGLEDFLDDVLDGRTCIDCSADITLLPGEDGDDDPHIWMDPDNAAKMALNIADGLGKIDPAHTQEYRNNAQEAADELTAFKQEMLDELDGNQYDLITFHDGFSYFADAFDLKLLAAVEEEEGSEASAKTVNQIISLVQEYDLPAIFTETNGSDSTAKMICWECGIQTFPLSMCMSGSGTSLSDYEDVIRSNIQTIVEAYR